MIVFNGINKRHFAIFFAAQMQFSHHPLIWFKADNPVRVSVETIDKELNGSSNRLVL
jgi:hypothetical protein